MSGAQVRAYAGKADEYAAATIAALASGFGIHRITVVGHCPRAVHHATVAARLEQLVIVRRPNERTMKASDVVKASRQYAAGDSLATVAVLFSIDATTVRRELHRVGVTTRARRGGAR